MISLEPFFVAREMAFEPVGPETISTTFSTTLDNGQERSFSLFVLSLQDGFGDKYIRFTVVPFVEQPYDGYPVELHSILGQINHDLPRLKFALDADGDLELVLDLLEAQLDDAGFDQAMQVLADYSAAYYPDIERILNR